MVSLVDITERKAVEAEIKRLNRNLKRRIDELQTLLDVAPDDLPMQYAMRDNVTVANLDLRMDRLLDDLLTYSRLGRRGELLEAVALDRLIQDIVELLAPPPASASPRPTCCPR